MILVTGANGKTGRAVINSLLPKGEAIRALVHRSEQIPQLQTLGVSDVIAGEMGDVDVIKKTLDGVRAVYFICPAMHPEEAAIGNEMINASREVGLEHFVYHSVLHPQLSKLPHHHEKLKVEEILIESGLNYTIMHPGMYMQNILDLWKRIEQQKVYAVPFGTSTLLSMVDLEDVAEAASIVLTGNGHYASSYDLCGPEALSAVKIAEVLGIQLGSTIKAESIPIDIWEQHARGFGLGDYQVSTLSAMFRHYAQYGFQGNPNVLSWLLGRPTTSFAAFIERTIMLQTASDGQ